MKKTFFYTLFIITVASCTEAPEFPNTPKIEFNDIIFKNLGDDADSLIVLVDFEDGDGDLGLGSTEITDEFSQRIYFNKANGQPIFLPSNEDEITEQELNFYLNNLMIFADRSVIDTLPDYLGDPICLNWNTNEIELLVRFNDQSRANVILKDTVYFQFNNRYNNFLVDFYIDNGAGFEEYDWRLESNCIEGFDGRFPILNESGKEKALEGTIRYGMTSFGFEPILGDKQIKLAITIIDRRGNYSNRIETPPFRLSEID
ncbi:MAG: hypothetical protein RLO81_05860 [Fulvivirga sp.]|uniref:hypothetical protein n=1 Tax=Fulvivirga sp. TaxID=1931237 RepID=UPI0032EF0361